MKRTHSRILIDLLRSTNGGPVASDIIRGVLWAKDAEPEDWVESVRHLAYVTNQRYGTPIKMVTRRDFVGFQIQAPAA